jgi:FKBP-type peptidyl-prolyl cis-trans isomerase
LRFPAVYGYAFNDSRNIYAGGSFGLYILESYLKWNGKMLKRTVLAIVVATTVLFACSAGGKSEKAGSAASAQTAAEGSDADTSYAFGVYFGEMLKQTGLTMNYDALTQGIRETLEGQPKFSEDEVVTIINTAIQVVMEKQAAENKQKEAEFLAANGKKSGIQTTVSGLQYEVIQEGTGAKPGPTDIVQVDYEGTLIDGTVFDSSYAYGEPVEFPLDEVIPGWSEGIQLMTVGSTYNLYIPSELAYGEQGAGNVIPPGSTLIFKVELKAIN